jgi:tRNA(fMet)-specific endonuclease VapC
MERYLLDTNILVFIICGEDDCLSKDITAIIYDNSNQLFVSTISVQELLQLYRIKKIKPKGFKNALEVFDAIENQLNIKILPFAKPHAKTLAKLKIIDGHNDPFDHSIIAHAMTENLNLVSSDRKFKEYTPQKLKFSFNKR